MRKEMIVGLVLLGIGTCCCAQGLPKAGEVVLSASKMYKMAHQLTTQNIAVLQQVKAESLCALLSEKMTQQALLAKIDELDSSYIPVLSALEIKQEDQFKLYGASIYRERPLVLLPAKDVKIPRMWKIMLPQKGEDISLKRFEPWLSSIQTNIEGVPEDVNAAISYLKEILLGEGAQAARDLNRKATIIEHLKKSPYMKEKAIEKLEEKEYSMERQNFDISRELSQLMVDLVDLLKTSPAVYKDDLVELKEILNRMPQTEFVKYLKDRIPYSAYTPIAGFGQ